MLKNILKLNTKTKVLLILFLFAFVAIYLLNLQYPLMYDDWTYMYIYGDDKHRVEGFADIVTSQYNHYFTWGGRSVVHFIAQSLLYFGIAWSDFLNSVAFLALLIVIYKITNLGNKVNPHIIVLLYALIWVFQPAFFETVLWITGSANYLWGTLIILLFLYPYCTNFICNKYSTDSILKYIILFFGGILAGWTNENMSVALISLLVLLFALMKYTNKAFSKWMFFGLAGSIVGALFLLLAPGNYVRLDVFENMMPSHTIWNGLMVIKGEYRRMIGLDIVFIICLIIFCKTSTLEPTKKKDKLYLSILFMLVAHIALLAMAASPTMPKRVWFGIMILATISIGILYANIEFRTIVLQRINTILFSFIFLFCIGAFVHKYKKISAIAEFWKEREEFILEQKELGIEDIILTKTYKIYNSYAVDDLSSDSLHFGNVAYAKHYGFKTVRLVPKEVIDFKSN